MPKDKIDTEAMKELSLHIAREICEKVIPNDLVDDQTIMEVHTTVSCVSLHFVCDAFGYTPEEYADALDTIHGVMASAKHRQNMIAAYKEVQRIGNERLH